RRHALRAAAPLALGAELEGGAHAVADASEGLPALTGRAREARIAAARARAWAVRLAERARTHDARAAILAALLATERAAALHAAREARAGTVAGPAHGRSGARTPPPPH